MTPTRLRIPHAATLPTPLHPRSGQTTVNPSSFTLDSIPALPKHEARLNSIEKQGLEATKTSHEMSNNEALEAQELDPQHSKQD